MTKDERQLKVLAPRDCGQELRQKKCRNSPGWMDEWMACTFGQVAGAEAVMVVSRTIRRWIVEGCMMMVKATKKLWGRLHKNSRRRPYNIHCNDK